MDDPTTAPKAARGPRWVKVVLALSLALNLAIAGAVAGFFLRDGPMRDSRTAMGYAAPYIIALPREARRGVFQTIRSDDALPKRKDRRAQYAEMLAALRSDPFDGDAVRTILTRQWQSVGDIQDVAQSAWLAAVSGMSTDERAAYVEKVEEVLRRGPRGKKGDRK